MLERKLIAKEKIENGFDLIGLEQLRIENKKMSKKNLDRDSDLRRLTMKHEATLASISQSRKNISTITEEIQVTRQLLQNLDKRIARC